MDDFISREDTIEKMEEVDWYHQNKNGEMVHGANPSEHQAWYKAEDVYKVLEDMSSAQPSRIEQALHGKTPEEQYKILYQLMFEYANTFNDARRAVIDWLGE